MLDRLDFWIAVITLALLGWAEFDQLVLPAIRRVKRFLVSPDAPMLIRATDEPAEPDVIRRDTYQPDTDEPTANELIFRLTEYRLSREQVLTLMARIKNPDGDAWMSANQISRSVGGTHAENLAIIAALRPKPPAAPAPAHLSRPKNGW